MTPEQFYYRPFHPAKKNLAAIETAVENIMTNSVTFIIGNGLDRSLGLNTSYRNFYDYVKKHQLHPDNSIYTAISKEDPELWADFELGLGRHTNSIEAINEKERAKWSRTINKELDEVKKDLKLYIKEQNSLADEHIPNIKFNRHSFYSGLETGQISNIQRQLDNRNPVSMRFVTLNYTDVLEKLFPKIGVMTLGRDYQIPQPIHHVHGSIHRKISLGVNDESQISSYIDIDEKNFLIKPELIKRMYDGRLETLSSYINAGNIIVLFGVSLGATDKYIWNQVITWLGGAPDKLLIIHHYEKELDVSDLTERETLQLSDRVKNKLLDYSELSDDDKNLAKSKIYIVPNTTELFAVRKD